MENKEFKSFNVNVDVPEPPTPRPRISEITAKWIHKDERGEIFCFYKDGQEYTLLTTRKGFARGGCVHNINHEYFVVLKGIVRYYIYSPSGVLHSVKVYIIGESGVVPAGYPHYLVALEDSITLEWGATTQEKLEKHLETRKLVDEINENNLRKRKT